MESSPLIESWIREEAEALERFYPRIMACRVAIEVPHAHHRKGSPYHLRIDLTVPGSEIVIKRAPNLSRHARQMGEPRITKTLEAEAPYKNLHRAISDAFKAAGRRLQDFARRRRGAVKRRELLPSGRVSRLLLQEGYGFLTTDDGREIYFHRNSVLNRGFRRLHIGCPVTFAEEMGETGPQASTVRIVGRRDLRPQAELATVEGD
jgi:cold shock CspA family protein